MRPPMTPLSADDQFLSVPPWQGNDPHRRQGVLFLLPLLVLLVLCWPPLLSQAAGKGPTGTIRVGVFPFAPFNYVDEQGVAQGLNPDLLREIVRDEDWAVEFVPGSWAEGLERLQRQEIDLMVSVAYTPERGEAMDFTYESVAELWGQVFVRPEGRSQNISDLAGHRVGVMRRDISGDNFIKTAAQMDVLCAIVEFASHGEVFAAVEQGVVDAGVAPQHFGLRHMDQYNLVASTIMFSPFSIYFASKKGRQHELLSHIDAHLSRWKADKASLYYQRLNYWMSSYGPTWVPPSWLPSLLLATVILAGIFAGFIFFLKKTVARRTKELRESEERYRSLYDSSPDGLMLTAPDGRIFSANASLCRMLARTEAEVIQIGRNGIMDTTDPRLVLALAERDRTGRLQCVELTCVRKDGEKIPVELSSNIFQNKEGETRTSIILHDITERKQIEAALQASLAEKDTLLREVHHRVKNNMAAIIGLFDLQRQTMDDQTAQGILVELSSRVRAMSLVHEKLYRSQSLSHIDFQDYLQSLLANLRTSFGSPDIRCQIDAQGVEMPLDLAVPCGMIINELITNALKYAFPGQRSGPTAPANQILVTLRHDLDCYTLTVADNGTGLSPAIDLNTTKTLGLALVRMLGQHQLGGDIQVDRTGGLRVTLTFSVRQGRSAHA